MPVGSFGIGGAGPEAINYPNNNALISGLRDRFGGGTVFRPGNRDQQGSSLYPYAPAFYMRSADVHAVLSVQFETGIMKVLASTSANADNGVPIRDNILYGTANTTKGSDGTLKAASPVVQIFHDGRSETNDESEGCIVTRLNVGQYLIKNCIGLNADAAWGGIDGGFDIPKDRNGQPLIWLDYEVNADGSVLVQTYHRTYPDAPDFAQNIIEGLTEAEPVDIPADQFVSVRVEMPVDSIWNQKMAAIQAESEAYQPGSLEE